MVTEFFALFKYNIQQLPTKNKKLFQLKKFKTQHVMFFLLQQPSQLSAYLASISIEKVSNMGIIIALLIRVDQLEEILQLSLNV